MRVIVNYTFVPKPHDQANKRSGIIVHRGLRSRLASTHSDPIFRCPHIENRSPYVSRVVAWITRLIRVFNDTYGTLLFYHGFQLFLVLFVFSPKILPGGITNQLFASCIKGKFDDDVVLFRIEGEGTEHMVNRIQEQENLQVC